MSRSFSTPPQLENSSFRRSLRTKRWEGKILFEDDESSNEDMIRRKHRSTFTFKKRETTMKEKSSKGKQRSKKFAEPEIQYNNNNLNVNVNKKNPMQENQYQFQPIPAKPERDPSIASRGNTLGSRAADKYWENIRNPDAIVRITIEGEVVLIPLRNLLAREREMRHLASEQGITSDRWNGSLLFRKVRNASLNNDVDKIGNFNILLNIDNSPSDSQQDQDPDPGRILSDSMLVNTSTATHDNSLPTWTHLLHTTLAPFYSLGRIPVPDIVAGPDILHLLEFFALMYTPSLLDFASYGAYVRVRLWGEYFFQRIQMSQWIMDQLFSSSTNMMMSRPKKGIYLVTSPENVTDLGMYYVLKKTGKRCTLFDGGLQVDGDPLIQMQDKKETSCSLVYDFFNADDPNDDEYENNTVESQLREDFRAFMQTSLVGSTVTFDMEEIEMISSNSYGNSKHHRQKKTSIDVIEKRAVLHINLTPSMNQNNHNKLKKQLQDEMQLQDTASLTSSGDDEKPHGFVPVTPMSTVTEISDLSMEQKDAQRKTRKLGAKKSSSNPHEFPLLTVINSADDTMSMASSLSGAPFDYEKNQNSNKPAVVSPEKQQLPPKPPPSLPSVSSPARSINHRKVLPPLSPSHSLILSSALSQDTMNIPNDGCRTGCSNPISLDEVNASWLWKLISPDSFMFCCGPDDFSKEAPKEDPKEGSNDTELNDASKLTSFNALSIHQTLGKTDDPITITQPEEDCTSVTDPVTDCGAALGRASSTVKKTLDLPTFYSTKIKSEKDPHGTDTKIVGADATNATTTATLEGNNDIK